MGQNYVCILAYSEKIDAQKALGRDSASAEKGTIIILIQTFY